MNKVVFEGNVINLYAEDYEYIMDNLEEDVQKVFRQLIEQIGQPAVVRGFALGIDPLDNTKLSVTHDGGFGSVASAAGTLIETTTDISGIALSDPTNGTTNIICVRSYQVLGSYDKIDETIKEGEKLAVDYSTYETVYNRSIEKWEIVAYTQAEYDALSTEDKENNIILGSTVGQGSGISLVEVDLSLVVYATPSIPDGSLTFDKFDPDSDLPQDRVENTDDLEIDDDYYDIPEDLQDDLNKIRTQLKGVKGTPNWDDATTGISASEPDLNKTHRQGVFHTENELDYRIQSSGTEFVVKTGKALIQKQIKTVSIDEILEISEADSNTVGDWVLKTGGEVHLIPAVNFHPFTLVNAPIREVHVVNAFDTTEVYTELVDYTVDYLTGIITSTDTGEIYNKSVMVFYEWGLPRLDIVALDETGLNIIQGTPGVKPLPERLGENQIALYYIYRPPIQDWIDNDDVVDCRTYVEPIRELREILPSDLGSYTDDNQLFHDDYSWAVHKLTFVDQKGGYQEFGLQTQAVKVIGADDTELGNSLTFDLRVNGINYSITTDTPTTTFDQVVSHLQTAIDAGCSGFQELGLSGKFSSDQTGLTAGTTYYFKVTVDGGAEVEYNITPDAFVPLVQEQTTVTTTDDSGNDNEAYAGVGPTPTGEYFYIYDETTQYYVWFNIDVAAVNEQSNINVTDGTAANFSGLYFSIFDGATQYDVWFDTTGAESVPGGAVSNPTECDISAAGNADAIANAIRDTIAGLAAFSSSSTDNPAIIDHDNAGATTDISDGTSAGVLTTSVLIQGADAYSSADPAPGGTGIQIDIGQGFNANSVASAIASGLDTHGSGAWTCPDTTTPIVVTHDNGGVTTDATIGTLAGTITVVTSRQGADAIPAKTTIADIITYLNIATTASATWSLTGGDIRCTSDLNGSLSLMALARGSSGFDLFSDITDFFEFDAAFPGSDKAADVTFETDDIRVTNSLIGDGNDMSVEPGLGVDLLTEIVVGGTVLDAAVPATEAGEDPLEKGSGWDINITEELSSGYQGWGFSSAVTGASASGLANDATLGYQEISSSTLAFVGSTVPAITTGDYTLNVSINGDAAVDIIIPIVNTDDWDAITSSLSGALSGATASIVAGKIRVSSSTFGSTSSVAISEGVSGTGLLATIDAIVDMATTVETAVPGVDGTLYTANIIVDGASRSVNMYGFTAQTIDEICSNIDTSLNGYASCAFNEYLGTNGEVLITSDTFGSTSSILISDVDLFSSVTNANGAASTAVDGIDGSYGETTELDSGTLMRSIVFTKENDEIWLSVVPQTSAITVILRYESVPGSDNLDQEVTYILPSKIDMSPEVIVSPVPSLYLIERGLVEGHHKIEIEVTSGAQLSMHKLIVGKLDLLYTAYGVYLDTIKSENAYFTNLQAAYAEITQIKSKGLILEWVTGADYTTNDITQFDGEIFISLDDHTSGSTFDPDRYHWKDVTRTDNEVRDLITESTEALTNRVNKETQYLLEMAIMQSYLLGRRNAGSDLFVETFFDENNSVSYTDLTNPSVIMDDTDLNNNWKRRDNNPLFKNGFAKPSNMNYMLEEIEKYDLVAIAQKYPMSMSRYDSVNNCYWMLWAKGVTLPINNSGNYGEIIKLSPNPEGGRTVQVTGRWILLSDSALTNAYFAGIDVTLDGAYLFLTITNNSASQSGAGLAKLTINTDGTLGENHVPRNQTLTWQETGWTSVGDFIAMNSLTRVANGNYYPDCTAWDENHIAILFIEADASSSSGDEEGSITFIEIADNGAGAFTTSNPRSDIELLGFYPVSRATTSELSSFSMIKEENDLWIKANNYGANYRAIYKFDVSEDAYSGTITQDSDSYTGDIAGYLNSSGVVPRFIKSSDKYDAYKDTDPQGDTITNEAITLSPDGHIFEVVSNGDGSDNGRFLVKRALRNAKYGEGQTVEEVKMLGFDDTNFPVDPLSCMVESDRYYWAADEVATANQVDIFRYDTLLGTYKHARLTNASWTTLSSLATDGTNLILQGKATNYERYLGTLASFVALMGDTYNITNTVSLGSAWGTATANHPTAPTEILNGITWDSDDSLWLISNLTSTSIDTLSSDGVTYTEDVHSRTAPIFAYGDIIFKNGLIYSIDRSTTTAPGQIIVFSKNLNAGGTLEVIHSYQDPSFLADTNGIRGIDFNNNDLVLSHQSNKFFRIKTLEDPDVMQLHSIMSEENVLLSSDVSCCTPVQERYFEPEEFTEYLPVDVNGVLDMSGAEDHWEQIPSTRNVPDRKYMAVGYYGQGFSILHLDEFLAGRSSTGMPRYDVTKIKTWHFKEDTVAYVVRATVIASGNVVTSNNYYTRNIGVEKDIIIVSRSGVISPIIDLKKGTILALGDSGDTLNGATYKGSITERNDSKGWNDTYNNKTYLSNSAENKVQMRTFTKEDTSEYEGENPLTIAMIGTNGGADILRIEWDGNGNRVVTQSFRNLFNDGSTGQYGIYLSPAGELFASDFVNEGDVYKLLDSWKVWDIKDSNIGRTSIFNGDDYWVDISPNSIYYKTPSGEDRHFMICGAIDGTSDSNQGGIYIIDAENGQAEFIFSIIANGWGFPGVDNFEDKIFAMAGYQATGIRGAMIIAKKNYFNDSTRIVSPTGVITHRESSNHVNSDGSPSGNWSTVEQITNKSRPRFSRDIDYAAQRMISNSGQRILCFSAEEQILQSWGQTGLNFQHFNSQDLCNHESIERDTDNPTHFHYVQTKIASDGFDIKEF